MRFAKAEKPMSGQAGDQPDLTFNDLIADPMIRTIMKADGIDERELRELFDRTAAHRNQQLGEDSEGSEPEEPLRHGVGIMLVSRDGRVFVGQRRDVLEEAWQMPQGGIDPGETPHAAALRELREEIGTDNVDVVIGTRDWLSYELPPELLERMRPRWRGQTQQWFLMRFRGTDDEIDVATEHPEFSAWKWVPADHLLDLIVPFKRELYRRVLREFTSYISSDYLRRT
jgi:putative (di)nucleoside polyphosphate hydrolase